jgi:hypothetical protein
MRLESVTKITVTERGRRGGNARVPTAISAFHVLQILFREEIAHVPASPGVWILLLQCQNDVQMVLTHCRLLLKSCSNGIEKAFKRFQSVITMLLHWFGLVVV